LLETSTLYKGSGEKKILQVTCRPSGGSLTTDELMCLLVEKRYLSEEDVEKTGIDEKSLRKFLFYLPNTESFHFVLLTGVPSKPSRPIMYEVYKRLHSGGHIIVKVDPQGRLGRYNASRIMKNYRGVMKEIGFENFGKHQYLLFAQKLA